MYIVEFEQRRTLHSALCTLYVYMCDIENKTLKFFFYHVQLSAVRCGGGSFFYSSADDDVRDTTANEKRADCSVLFYTTNFSSVIERVSYLVFKNNLKHPNKGFLNCLCVCCICFIENLQ